MKFKEMLREKILVYDGSKGYLLMQKGLAPGDYPDMWNLDYPDAVSDIHKAYVGAGADVIQTNTLQSSRFHLEARGLYERLADINQAGVELAKKAAGGKALVAASIGPLGGIMAPFGDTGFDDAYAAFSEQIKVLLAVGVDILHFETFTDLSELRIAVLAAKDIDKFAPLIATISIERGGRTVMGDSAACAAASLAMLGVDCAGANCGLPPAELLANFNPFAAFHAPLCSKPNAGTPIVDGKTVNYGATEDEFYETAFGFARLGARLIGGCCGSGPRHVQSIRKAADIMNADSAYEYSRVVMGAAGQGDLIELCSHGRSAVFSRSALAEYMGEALAGAADMPPQRGGGSPRFIESGDGKMLTVDLTGLHNEINVNRSRPDVDKIVEILSDASESDADATIFMLRSGYDGSAAAGAGIGEGAGHDSNAACLLGMLAENARAYHNKPLLFHAGDMGALDKALRHYCGVPAILLAKSDAKRGGPAIDLMQPAVIEF